jgi:hypothetical protein
MFEEEACKYDVYPLAKQQDRLSGDQKELVCYAPGVSRIAEKASALAKHHSHTIVTALELTGKEEGVILAVTAVAGKNPAAARAADPRRAAPAGDPSRAPPNIILDRRSESALWCHSCTTRYV